VPGAGNAKPNVGAQPEPERDKSCFPDFDEILCDEVAKPSEDAKVMKLLDEDWIQGQFLSFDGTQTVIFLINLHSGTWLDMLALDVVNNGTMLKLQHALCPTFHNIVELEAGIQDDELLPHDPDDAVRFQSLHEVVHKLQGDSGLIKGFKLIPLPFRCQSNFKAHPIATEHNELLLMVELKSLEIAVKDNKIDFETCLIKTKSLKKQTWRLTIYCMETMDTTSSYIFTWLHDIQYLVLVQV